MEARREHGEIGSVTMVVHPIALARLQCRQQFRMRMTEPGSAAVAWVDEIPFVSCSRDVIGVEHANPVVRVLGP